MPHLLTIHKDSVSTKCTIPHSETLLTVLQQNQVLISAPCGGHGTCGKCKVEVLEMDDLSSERHSVLACQYVVKGQTEVFIPQTNEVKIQSESYFPELKIKYNSVNTPCYGIAVDIGTTTVVVYLEDLQKHKNIDITSFLNPQKAFGADVISRIQFAMENDGLLKLQQILLKELNQAISLICKRNNVLFSIFS